ncbi:MAG: PD-(D/E)XK nuclease family protein [Candidatus Korarchaeota archaeon]
MELCVDISMDISRDVLDAVRSKKAIVIFYSVDSIEEYARRYPDLATGFILFGDLAKRILSGTYFREIDVIEFIVALKKYLEEKWDSFEIFKGIPKNGRAIWTAVMEIYPLLQEIHQRCGLDPKCIETLKEIFPQHARDLITMYNEVYNSLENTWRVDDISLLYKASRYLQKVDLFKIIGTTKEVHVWRATNLSTVQLFFLKSLAESLEKIGGKVVLHVSPGDFMRPPLSHIVKELEVLAPESSPIFVTLSPPITVEKIELPTEMQEVEWVMRTIKRLVLNKEYSWDDIVIYCRDISNKLSWIESFADKYGIPIKLGFAIGKPLISHPIVSLLLQFFKVLSSDFERNDLLALIHNRLFNIENKILHEIESFSRKRKIVGGKDLWLREIKNTDNDISKDGAKFLNKLIEDIFAIGSKGKVKDHIERINSLYEKYIFPQVKNKNCRGATEVIKKLREAFYYIYLTHGESEIDFSEFSSTLQAMILLMNYTSPTEENAVLVTSPVFCCHPKKVVFYIGLNEDPSKDECIELLSDSDKRLINEKMGRRIFSTLEDSILESWYLLRDVLYSATERVFFSYSYLSSKGTQLNPSTIFQLVSGNRQSVEPSEILLPTDESNVLSPAELLKLAVSSSLQNPNLLPNSLQEVYTQAIGGRDAEISRMCDGKFTCYEGIVDSELVANEKLSATGLERYGNCPMAYFFDKILHLKPLYKVDRDIHPRDVGEIVHSILEKTFGSHLLERNYDVNAVIATLKNSANEIFSNTKIHTSQIPFWNMIRLQLMDNNGLLPRVVKGELEMLKQEGAIVAATEYEFNEEIPFNRINVEFKGKVDRIDIGSKGNVIITDYKHRASIDDGSLKYNSLQLAFYCEILRRKGVAELLKGKLTDVEKSIARILGRYVSTLRVGKEKKFEYTPEKQKELETYVECYSRGIKSGIFPPYPLSKQSTLFKKVRPHIITHSTGTCDICDYESICRVDISSRFLKENPLSLIVAQVRSDMDKLYDEKDKEPANEEGSEE